MWSEVLYYIVVCFIIVLIYNSLKKQIIEDAKKEALKEELENLEKEFFEEFKKIDLTDLRSDGLIIAANIIKKRRSELEQDS